jgi:hypothetical protein
LPTCSSVSFPKMIFVLLLYSKFCMFFSLI